MLETDIGAVLTDSSWSGRGHDVRRGCRWGCEGHGDRFFHCTYGCAVRLIDEKKFSLCDDVSIGFERDVFFGVKGISCVIKCRGYVVMSLSCCYGSDRSEQASGDLAAATVLLEARVS